MRGLIRGSNKIKMRNNAIQFVWHHGVQNKFCVFCCLFAVPRERALV